MRKSFAVFVRSRPAAKAGRLKLFLTSLMFCAATMNLSATVIFTNDFAIGLADKDYDGQDIVISNCVLTADGQHTFAALRVASGGTLIHTASDDGTISDFIPTLAEPHVLTDTNPVTLANSNVFTSAMLVTDTNQMMFYFSGVDYVLGSDGAGFTTLQRTTNSLIPDGDTVLVNYFYIGYASAGLNLVVTGNLEVEPGANIQTGGRGFAGGQGPGLGGSSGFPQSGGGAGHGGFGGLSSSNSAGGGAYDSTFGPTSLGSGGGRGVNSAIGGNGGGAIRLVVSNDFVLNGAISANGLNATNSRSGGGSGGSIWLTTENFSGNGSIVANGGAGEPVHGGGGGGGRIVIEFAANNFSGTITAFGGAGGQRGGAGTIFLRTNGTLGQVTFDNGNISSGAATPLQFTSAADLIVQGRAIASVSSGQTLGNLLVRSNSSVVTLATNNAMLTLTVQRDATIEKGAAIPLDGKGYTPGTGPGAGLANDLAASGAGHGGYGGSGVSATSAIGGGNYYGSLTSPTTFGSGGRAPSSLYFGGSGGGAVRMTVLGNLRLDGEISADANNGLGSLASGGAGGSVWLTLGGLSGSGTISANGGSGGNGGLPSGGGGAGGRIAVYFASNNFSGNITAVGGNGAVPGGAGIIFTKASSDIYGSLTVNNGGLRGTNTVFDTSTTLVNLTIDGGAVLSSIYGLFMQSNLFVGADSALRIGAVSSVNVSAAGATVAPGGSISADGLGYVGTGPGVGGTIQTGSGGGGHGGYGGRGFGTSFGANGGNYYDSILNPTQGGSAGGGGSLAAGNGGGALRLTVSGTLVLDGKISANGLNTVSNNAGGGAGGTVYLSVGGFSGGGQISADGGAGHLPNGGGGAGGRIAVYCATRSLFTGTFSAKAGAGFGNGGAGTIYLRRSPDFIPVISYYITDLVIDNGGLLGTNTVIDTSFTGVTNLTVTGGARASVTASSLSVVNLTVATNSALLSSVTSLTMTMATANVAAGGMISADGIISQGSGQGGSSSLGSGGGGHGGYGGRGAGAAGGNSYGSITAPTTTGSPGGFSFNNPIGSGGGGSLRLIVSGQLALNGKISANGSSFLSTSNNITGGGSGGSIYLTVGGLSGLGAISTDGGASTLSNGGGGGGRVAVYYTSNLFTGTFSAKGGAGFVAGGAGTVYVRASNASSSTASVTIDNGGQSGTNTIFGDQSSSGFNLTVTGGARLTGIPSTLNSLTVGANSAIFGNISSTISGNASVAAGGIISADGLGLFGSGQGGFSSFGSGGGGHGGYGGRGAAATGGNAYDSASSPNSPGSGGGGSSSSGGAGGGFVRITVNGSLALDGKISANGLSTNSNNAGGGAGGSVWLTIRILSGAGVISTDGGAGHLPNGGGGGGGRVAIYYSDSRASNSFTGTISAMGGNGFVRGGAGTIYVTTNGANLAKLIVDNGGFRGTNTSVAVSGGSSYGLTVQGGAIAVNIGTPFDLLVRSNSWVSQTGSFTVSRNATIESGGAINVDGLGNSSLGQGDLKQSQKGGGGHGGYGALNPPGFGGVYDSVSSPTGSGSAGGNGSGSSFAPFGGIGGGAVRVTVGSVLTVNGKISANATDGDVNSGGGSGGSLWLQPQTFAGSGEISARGGNGNGSAGGGGGGRIAITYTTNLFTGTFSACGGNGAIGGGAGTVYLKANNQPNSLLLVDNCGIFGTNTPLSQTFGLASDISVSGGAVGEFQGSLPLLSNVTVAGGALLTGRATDTNLFLPIAGDLNIGFGSALSLDAKGFSQGNGTGAGASLSSKGSGGGYGGIGGESLSGAPGGTTYGSETQPVDRGSGGGAGSGSPFGGSQGGGAARLFVGGTLNVDGDLTANGGDGIQDDSGGGSGGSIYVTAKNLTGNGIIAADGGAGDLYGGGGGGGGRIAFYSPMNTFTGIVSTAGGDGAFFGVNGTIFTSSNLMSFGVISQSPTGLLSNLVSQVTLNFNEPINPASVGAGDALIYTPTGLLPSNNVVVSLIGLSTLRATFAAQSAAGDYRIEAGPGIEDLLGQPMSEVYTGAFALTTLIVGTVTDTNGQPVAGVVVSAVSADGSLGTANATTDATGTYVLGVPPGWSGTVTPSLTDFMFVPGARSYTNIVASVTGQNFLIVPTISPAIQAGRSGGNLSLGWNGISNVTYQVYSSTNLTDWHPFDVPIVGTNGPAQLMIPVGDEPQRFFRLGAQN